MTRIVTTHYRYKRPPPKRAKAAALDMPAVVKAPSKRAEVSTRIDTDASQSAIVTARQPKKAASLPAGLLADTDADHQQRGDAADALWREIVRRAIDKK